MHSPWLFSLAAYARSINTLLLLVVVVLLLLWSNRFVSSSCFAYGWSLSPPPAAVATATRHYHHRRWWSLCSSSSSGCLSFSPTTTTATTTVTATTTCRFATRTRKRYDRDSYDDDNDNDSSSSQYSWSNKKGASRKKDRNDSYYYYDDNNNDNEYENDYDGVDDDDDDYHDYYDDDNDDDTTTTRRHFQKQKQDHKIQQPLEWEFCPTDAGDVQILLPPPTIEKPLVVFHFVGGTFWGSAPTLWYRQLLEDLVRYTQAAVVATSIPVTIMAGSASGSAGGSADSPLNHVTLARKVQRQFQVAWQQVLLDEYSNNNNYDGDDDYDGDDTTKNNDSFEESVPVVAIGHSLGARLLVVLATLSKQQQPRRRRRTTTTRQFSNYLYDDLLLLPPDYKAFVLMSFTNYGAAAGIPGILSLSRSSRRLERERAAAVAGAAAEAANAKNVHVVDNDDDENKDWAAVENDEYTIGKRSARRQQQQQPRRYRDGDNDGWFDDDDHDDDNDEEEWADILQDLQEGIRQQALKVKSALTPASSELEFYPSPEQLWRALDKDKRYRIPQTLVVQFDDDEIDQSVPLTNAIKETSDVKFARLRGTHLTPISTQGKADSVGQLEKKTWLGKFNSRVSRIIGSVLLSGGKRQLLHSNEERLQELRQSISRYITEVVRKQ